MVISNADGDIRHPAVVEVMDELRLAGMARLASAVRAERRVHP
jgi:biopolymer transport protein ExbD